MKRGYADRIGDIAKSRESFCGEKWVNAVKVGIEMDRKNDDFQSQLEAKDKEIERLKKKLESEDNNEEA